MKKNACAHILFLTSFLTQAVFSAVNPQNGNFYLQSYDYQHQCYSLPLFVSRTYNSMYRRQSLFGLGWSSNLDQNVAYQDDFKISIVEADGYVSHFFRKDLKDTKSVWIDDIIGNIEREEITAQDNKQKSSKAIDKTIHPLDLKAKLFEDDELFYVYLKKYIPEKRWNKKPVFQSNDRLISTIRKNRKYIVRTFINGKTYTYALDGKLLEQSDAYKNYVRYKYKRNRLKTVQSSCFHNLTLFYNDQDQVTKIRDHMGYQIEYVYQYKKLIPLLDVVIGMDSQIIDFDYSKFNLLEKITFPAGQFIKNTYDKKQEKVLQVFDSKRKHTDVYTYTKNRGLLETLIENSNQEKHTFIYDINNKKNTYIAPNGHKNIQTFMDCCSLPTKQENHLGDILNYAYNDQLQLISFEKNKARFDYQYANNLLRNIDIDKKKQITLQYNDYKQPNYVFFDRNQYVKAKYSSFGALEKIHNKQHSFSVQSNSYGAYEKIHSNINQRNYTLHFLYDSLGRLKEKRFKPYNEKAYQIFTKRLQSMIDLLHVKQYKPKI